VTDRVKKEVLQKFKEERSILHAITRRKANWIGHIVRRNRLLKHVLEGNIEDKRRRWRRRKQLRITLRKWEDIVNRKRKH